MQRSSAFKIILVLLNQQIEAFDTNGRQMAKHYPQMVCKSHRQQWQKSHLQKSPLLLMVHVPPWGTLSSSCADTECVAGLKCSPGTVTPTLPTATFVPHPGKAAPRCCPQNPPGETIPMRRFLEYWLRYLLLPLKVYVLLLVFPAPSSHPRVCHCSSALRPASFGGAGTRGVAVGI